MAQTGLPSLFAGMGSREGGRECWGAGREGRAGMGGEAGRDEEQGGMGSMEGWGGQGGVGSREGGMRSRD